MEKREALLRVPGTAARRLAAVAANNGFDGYFVNGEGPLRNGTADVPRLARFLRLLREACRLPLIHISEPTRPERVSYAGFCLK